MGLDKFEEPTKRILQSESLRQSVRDNSTLIDQNLLLEFQKFASPDLLTFNFAGLNKIETTEEVDIRVKKLKELNERLKTFKKNFKKQSKRTYKQCDLHPIPSQSQLSEQLKSFMEKDMSQIDIENIIKKDEDVIQQHASNLEKLSKFMLTAEGCNLDQTTLPAVEVIRDTTTLLREIDSDIDYLIESEAMYNGLSTDAPTGLYEDEFKHLTDNLYTE